MFRLLSEYVIICQFTKISGLENKCYDMATYYTFVNAPQVFYFLTDKICILCMLNNNNTD